MLSCNDIPIWTKHTSRYKELPIPANGSEDNNTIHAFIPHAPCTKGMNKLAERRQPLVFDTVLANYDLALIINNFRSSDNAHQHVVMQC